MKGKAQRSWTFHGVQTDFDSVIDFYCHLVVRKGIDANLDEDVTEVVNRERNKKKRPLKQFDSSPFLLKRAVFPSVILKKKKSLPSLKHHGAKTKLRTKINALS